MLLGDGKHAGFAAFARLGSLLLLACGVLRERRANIPQEFLAKAKGQQKFLRRATRKRGSAEPYGAYENVLSVAQNSFTKDFCGAYDGLSKTCSENASGKRVIKSIARLSSLEHPIPSRVLQKGESYDPYCYVAIVCFYALIL